MAKPFPCPGECVYCPGSPEAPKSYTVESPAVLRARSCGFDASRQVEIRLRTLAEMGHALDKVELIVMGGRFCRIRATISFSLSRTAMML